MIEINYLAVLVAAVASMIVGWAWFGPLFGKRWIALSGISMPETMTPEVKAGMNKSYALMFVGSLVMSFVLAHALALASATLNTGGLSGGLIGGFWNWLGFVAPVLLGPVLWEGKPWKLWVLNAGYYLVALCVMGVILSLWR